MKILALGVVEVPKMRRSTLKVREKSKTKPPQTFGRNETKSPSLGPKSEFIKTVLALIDKKMLYFA